MTETTQPRIYLDTNVFILLIEGSPEKAEIVRSLFSVLSQRRDCAVTSELTLAEVLAPPRRDGALDLFIKRPVYLNLLVWGGFVELVPISRDILIETANLREVARHKLPDAIHIVTAVKADCTHFLSADSDGKRVPEQTVWIRPDADGLAAVREILSA